MPNISCKEQNYRPAKVTQDLHKTIETILLHLDVSIMPPTPEVSHFWCLYIKSLRVKLATNFDIGSHTQ